MSERWRPVPGYAFEASNLGRIRRPDGSIVPQGTDRNGYRFVRYWRDRRCRSAMVGPLVCAAFHGPKPFPSAHADHQNDIRDDNASDNLRWLTPKANRARAKTLKGRKLPPRPYANVRRGENNPSSKLTESAVVSIRATYRKGSRQCGLPALAEKYGVSHASIHAIVKGRNWKGVGDARTT